MNLLLPDMGGQDTSVLWMLAELNFPLSLNKNPKQNKFCLPLFVD